MCARRAHTVNASETLGGISADRTVLVGVRALGGGKEMEEHVGLS